ncbi:MAG: hypothetical protein R3C56_43795 [Pirellulaceae bacterium]
MNLFNAEPQQDADAQGELINTRVSDAPQRQPTYHRGLRRRRHLRQTPAMLKRGCQSALPSMLWPRSRAPRVPCPV